MAPEKNFEGYRAEYFINPKNPLEQKYSDAVTLLVSQLLGLPATDNLSDGSLKEGLDKFVYELIERMRHSRKFDHLSVAQLNPDDNFPAILAHIASTLRNNNTIIGDVSPVESKMEQEAVNWLITKIARYDETKASGALVTGGTLANLTGLMVARERLSNNGWNGVTPAYILTSPMAHYSVKKSAAILAPRGIIQVLEVPMMPGSFTMDTHALEHYVNACTALRSPIMAIVAVAGQTETGLVDNLQHSAEVAQEHDIYFHVDGAYGAPYVLSKQAALFNGMELSNSLVVDPHKYGYTPFSSGSILFKSAEEHSLIEETNTDGSAYMFKTGKEREEAHAFKQVDSIHLGRHRLEGSMGGQGAAALWAVIQTLGVEGLGFILDHTIDVTDAVYRTLMTSPYFKPSFVPELNTICFYPHDKRIAQIDNPALQSLLVEKASAILEQATGAYLSTTTIPAVSGAKNERADMKVFRFVATHPHTEIKDALQIIDDLHAIWDELITQELGKI